MYNNEKKKLFFILRCKSYIGSQTMVGTKIQETKRFKGVVLKLYLDDLLHKVDWSWGKQIAYIFNKNDRIFS